MHARAAERGLAVDPVDDVPVHHDRHLRERASAGEAFIRVPAGRPGSTCSTRAPSGSPVQAGRLAGMALPSAGQHAVCPHSCRGTRVVSACGGGAAAAPAASAIRARRACSFTSGVLKKPSARSCCSGQNAMPRPRRPSHSSASPSRPARARVIILICTRHCEARASSLKYQTGISEEKLQRLKVGLSSNAALEPGRTAHTGRGHLRACGKLLRA